MFVFKHFFSSHQALYHALGEAYQSAGDFRESEHWFRTALEHAAPAAAGAGRRASGHRQALEQPAPRQQTRQQPTSDRVMAHLSYARFLAKNVSVACPIDSRPSVLEKKIVSPLSHRALLILFMRRFQPRRICLDVPRFRISKEKNKAINRCGALGPFPHATAEKSLYALPPIKKKTEKIAE